jgi:hypothetical protein
MEHTNTVLQVSIDLLFRAPGNIIHRRLINFEISREKEFYRAVPLCTEQDKILFALPEEICFKYLKGKLVQAGATQEKYLDVIADISSAMTEKDLFF